VDKVIVTGLLIISAVVAASIVVITLTPSISIGSASVSDVSLQESDRIRTSLHILSAQVHDDGMSIDAWLKNTGDVPINPVSNIDLILRQDGAGGVYLLHGLVSGNRWSVVPGTINVLNRGETVRLRIGLADAATPGLYHLSATAPNGVRAETTFEALPSIPPSPTPSCQAGDPAFRTGSPGSNQGRFNRPYDLAIDASGNVYVADTANHRVQKFDSQGVFITQLGVSGSSDGELSFPMGVAVDAAGGLYVADTGNNRVQKFDGDGDFQRKWDLWGPGNDPFVRPVAIAVDSAGGFYVSDTGTSMVVRFDQSGAFMGSFGAVGSRTGRFMANAGISVDRDDNLYVVDVNNSRVQVFDPEGGFLRKWGRQGFGDGEFSQPHRIAVDQTSGNVYVTDGNDRVQKFNSSGRFLAKWSTYGSSSLSRPFGIGVAPSGRRPIWLTDGNMQLYRFCSGER